MYRLLAIALLSCSVAHAHPGWGLQVDTAGNVYFTDLEHVYVADDTGVAERLVTDVHAHALYLDDDERLVGDHSWVDGQGAFHTSWWRSDADGNRVELSEFEAAAVVGMAAPGGGRLMLESNVQTRRAELLRVSADGTRELAAGGPFGSVDGRLAEARFGVFGAHISDGRGGLLVTSGGQLRAIDERGRVTTLLGDGNGFPFDSDRRSALLGLSLAFNGDVFVADIDRRRLVRHDRATGEAAKVLGADLAWDIVGVHVAGTYVYLLEFNRLPWSSEVRVRRMDSNGTLEFVARRP